MLSPMEPRRRLRVGVLFGGRSGEHEVSLQSARAVVASLERAGHEVVPIGITREGRWLVSGDPLRRLASGETRGEQLATMLPEPGTGLVVFDDGRGEAGAPPPLDVVFPVLHGTYGEDGTVQGLLELARVPYVGAGVLASAVGMDKIFQKTLWRGLGLPIVPFVTTSRATVERRIDVALAEVEHAFGYPCFAKPANLGSSVGVHKAHTPDELRFGLLDAARYDTDLIVERAVDARELECSVLGNDEPIASVVGEVVPNAEFYDYRAKYLDEGSRCVIPAEVPTAVSERIRELAIRAFTSLKCSGLARVDFFLERGTGTIYLNEINTMPGFTSISMYPKLWEASGLSFPDLVDRLVQLALERFADRSRNETRYEA
jgi:D-alanine-D-alanine ligase